MRSKKFDRSKPQTPNGRPVAGLHAVSEALKVRSQSFTALWFRPNWKDSADLKKLHDLASSARVKTEERSVSTLDKLTTQHQGVLGFVNSEPVVDWNELKKEGRRMVLILDGVEDPHNLGAVLRTAWLLKAQALFVPQAHAVGLTATVSKVAQGASEHVPVEVSSSLPQTLEILKKNGFWVYGLSHDAKGTLYELKLPEKVAWVLGSESHGIRKPVERQCDELIAIPQSDPKASYNVSVAAALAMGETFRQHQFSSNC